MNELNLTITSKTIKVKERKLKATWTHNMSQNLSQFSAMNTSGYYEYKYENQYELDIVIKYFNKYSVIKEYVYYHSDNKMLRRVKLLILKRNELSEILEKIVKNSIIVTFEDMLTRQLSSELAESIDKEIIENLKKDYLLKK